MSTFLRSISCVFLIVMFVHASAQEDFDKNKIRFNLNEDKTSFVGMEMVNQIWARYIWNNPDKYGVEQYGDIDLALRRSRLTMYAKLMDKVLVYTQFGYDGQTYRSEKNPGVNLYNAQVEFIVKKEKLHIGLGLNSWNGVSRYNNSNFAEFLVVDQPGFAYPVEGTFDQFGRQLGIYAKGTLNKLQYRISVVKPFETGIDSISTPVTLEKINENFALKGYFSWQFFDQENTMFPELTMNNLGRAKLLNVGAGFYYHPEAMLVKSEKDISTVDPFIVAWLLSRGQSDLLPQFADYFPSRISDVFLASADVFLDMPTKRNGAITSYLGYYYYFFGPGYLRSGSTMNVSKMSPGIAISQGIGSSQWEVGTGHVVRGEFGYMLPGDGMKNRIQPYAAFTWKDFEELDDNSFQFDAGINWLMYAHNIKWTLQYSSRPIFNWVDEQNVWTDTKGQVILQSQIYF